MKYNVIFGVVIFSIIIVGVYFLSRESEEDKNIIFISLSAVGSLMFLGYLIYTYSKKTKNRLFIENENNWKTKYAYLENENYIEQIPYIEPQENIIYNENYIEQIPYIEPQETLQFLNKNKKPVFTNLEDKYNYKVEKVLEMITKIKNPALRQKFTDEHSNYYRNDISLFTLDMKLSDLETEVKRMLKLGK